MFKILVSFVIVGLISAYSAESQKSSMEDFGKWNPSKRSEGMDSDWSEDKKDSRPVSAAIKTRRYHKELQIDSDDEEPTTHVIRIKPYKQPIRFVYKTSSNPLSVEQIHESAPGKTEETKSEDEPHRVTHEVLRPVIQEVKEIIQPYRRIRQEVRPVMEEILTVVSQKDGKDEREDSAERSAESGKRQYKQKRRESERSEEKKESEEESNKKVKYEIEIENSAQRRSPKQETKTRVAPQEYLAKIINRDSKKEEERLKESEAQVTETRKRTPGRGLWMRSPILPIEEIKSSNEESSNQKVRYQSNELTEDTKKTRRYAPEVTSVLERMNKVMLGDNLSGYLAAETQSPMLTLNNGKIRLARGSPMNIMSPDLYGFETFDLSGY